LGAKLAMDFHHHTQEFCSVELIPPSVVKPIEEYIIPVNYILMPFQDFASGKIIV
jgi:hypothetical protein